MPNIVWEALFAQQRARLKGMPAPSPLGAPPLPQMSLRDNGVHWEFRKLKRLFTLDTGICLTYIPEKLSMCYYITERDRKGDTAHVQ